MSNTGFQITEDDVYAVLKNNALQVANASGKDFDTLAVEWWNQIDEASVVEAALGTDVSSANGDQEGELSLQTDAAHGEIHRQLVNLGCLTR